MAILQRPVPQLTIVHGGGGPDYFSWPPIRGVTGYEIEVSIPTDSPPETIEVDKTVTRHNTENPRFRGVAWIKYRVRAINDSKAGPEGSGTEVGPWSDHITVFAKGRIPVMRFLKWLGIAAAVIAILALLCVFIPCLWDKGSAFLSKMQRSVPMPSPARDMPAEPRRLAQAEQSPFATNVVIVIQGSNTFENVTIIGVNNDSRSRANTAPTGGHEPATQHTGAIDMPSTNYSDYQAVPVNGPVPAWVQNPPTRVVTLPTGRNEIVFSDEIPIGQNVLYILPPGFDVRPHYGGPEFGYDAIPVIRNGGLTYRYNQAEDWHRTDGLRIYHAPTVGQTRPIEWHISPHNRQVSGRR